MPMPLPMPLVFFLLPKAESWLLGALVFLTLPALAHTILTSRIPHLVS